MSISKEIEEGKNEYSEKETPLVTKATEGTALQDQVQEATSVSASAKCAYCGQAIPGDQRFCVYCGAPTGISANSIVCQNPNCGDTMPLGTLFCGSCGMSMRPSSPVDIRGRLVVDVPNQTALPKKQNKAWLGAGVSVAVLLLIGLGFLFGSWFREQSAPRALVSDTPGDKPSPIPPSEPGRTPPTPSQPPLEGIQTSNSNPSPGPPSSLPKPEPQPAPPPPPALRPKLPPGSYKIIATQGVPIRSAPEEIAKIVSETAPGKEVNVTKDLGPWVEIHSSKGRAGYIPRNAIGDAPLPETEQKNTSAATSEG